MPVGDRKDHSPGGKAKTARNGKLVELGIPSLRRSPKSGGKKGTEGTVVRLRSTTSTDRSVTCSTIKGSSHRGVVSAIKRKLWGRRPQQDSEEKKNRVRLKRERNVYHGNRWRSRREELQRKLV